MSAIRIIAFVVACAVLWQDPPKPPAQPQPVVPLAASSLAASPDAYIGSTVSITAPVRQALGGTAFTIGQADSAAGEVLVVAALLNAPVQAGGYVTVIGEVVTFDPSVVAARLKGAAPQLDPGVVATYAGRPAVIATSVINASLTDLAKRIPPPMTPEEQALSKTMKQVGPAFNGVRAADGSKAVDSLAQAATLTKAFHDIEPFWKARGRTDAVQWAQQAQKEAGALEAAAKAGRWDEVKAAASRLQPICQSCHTTYRERLDDGTYRLKSVPLK